MNNIDIKEFYKESENLYDFFNSELENVFHSLKNIDQNSSFLNIKFGVYQYLKKIIPCFNILFMVSETSSIDSLLTLERMITDNYAILYLLTNYGSKREQLLRYYLFLLDATNSRSDILKDFPEDIKKGMPANATIDADNAIAKDKIFSNELHKKINEIQSELLINKEIKSNSNWKFKDIKKGKNNNRLNWIELYEIARIANHHAKVLHNYDSSFVHGLGMSLMNKSDKEILWDKSAILNFCIGIMSMIIKIITIEFPDETKHIIINPNIVYSMNRNWDKKL